jgi:hypothetical protein
VQKQQSARSDISFNKPIKSPSLSPTAVCRVTVKPSSTACSDSQAALVSTVWPVTISSPCEKISRMGIVYGLD